MKSKWLVSVGAGWLLIAGYVQADVVSELQSGYGKLGAKQFSAVAGKAMWERGFVEAGSGHTRRCITCHGADLGAAGKHASTGKRIEPMAPGVNPQRLTDAAKVEKWFLRNCKWTLGRECTPQEKGDFLSYIQSR